MKKGAPKRSHEPIFKIEEAMLGKHISFETTNGNT